MKDLTEILEQQIHFINASCKEYDNGIEFEAIRIAGHIRTLLHDVYTPQNNPKLVTIVGDLESLLKSNIINDGTKFKQANTYIQKLKGLVNKTLTISSKSLLTQLSLKDKVKYIDTRIPNHPNGLSSFTISNSSNIELTSEAFSFPYLGLVTKKMDGFGREGKSSLTFEPLFKSFPSKENTTIVNFTTWWNEEVFDNKKGLKLSRKDIILNVANKDGYAHVDENEEEEYITFKQQDSFRLPYNDTSKIFDEIPLFPTVRQIAYELQIGLEDLKNETDLNKDI